MSDTPLNVFGRSDDAEGVAGLIAGTLEASILERAGAEFVVKVAPKRRFRRSEGRAVTVHVQGDHFEGDAGRTQLLGMSNFLADSMSGAGIEEVLSMVPDLRLAVGIKATPPVEPESSDELFRLAFRVAQASDGFVLSMGHGRVWAGDGRLLASIDERSGANGHSREGHDIGADDFVPEPPSVERVTRRLLALTAVAARGLAEHEGEHLDEARSAILVWVDGLELADELEAGDRKLFETPAGELAVADQTNASWRVEGAVVLAWSLGLLDLPSHDELVDPGDLVATLGFPDAAKTATITAALEVRSRESLNALADQLFAVHWRLREHSLRPRPLDFAEFSRTARFGPLNIEGIRLLDQDLAVGDRPLMDADPSAVAATTSAVMERHLAANWLRDGGVYSETDTST